MWGPGDIKVFIKYRIDVAMCQRQLHICVTSGFLQTYLDLYPGMLLRTGTNLN